MQLNQAWISIIECICLMPIAPVLPMPVLFHNKQGEGVPSLFSFFPPHNQDGTPYDDQCSIFSSGHQNKRSADGALWGEDGGPTTSQVSTLMGSPTSGYIRAPPAAPAPSEGTSTPQFEDAPGWRRLSRSPLNGRRRLSQSPGKLRRLSRSPCQNEPRPKSPCQHEPWPQSPSQQISKGASNSITDAIQGENI